MRLQTSSKIGASISSVCLCKYSRGHKPSLSVALRSAPVDQRKQQSNECTASECKRRVASKRQSREPAARSPRKVGSSCFGSDKSAHISKRCKGVWPFSPSRELEFAPLSTRSISLGTLQAKHVMDTCVRQEIKFTTTLSQQQRRTGKRRAFPAQSRLRDSLEPRWLTSNLQMAGD